MRIIHIIDYLQPKLGYQETFLAREHAKAGHEVYVVTSDRYSPSIYEANKELLGGRIVGSGLFEEEGIKIWRLRTLFEIPRAIWIRGLEDKIQELRPDIVVVHAIVTFGAIRVARLKKKLGGFKLIYDDHMTFDNSTSILRVLYPFFKWTYSRLIQQSADALVAAGHASRTFMQRVYGFPPERLTVIPLGADDELFRFSDAARQQVRSELSLSDSDFVFIYTGKVTPLKGIHILIEAMELMKDHVGVKVLIVGSGPEAYIEKLKLSIRAKNLEDRFIWHGAANNNELYKLYSASDVAVWPVGASISILEAMACGLPIIVDESPNMNEMTYVTNQLRYRDHDASDLACQMEKLLDTELRRELGYQARNLVDEKLSWRIIAKQFVELVS